MSEDKRVPEPDQLGRPSARDTVARARAAAGPAAAKASAAAGPAVEKAAERAGKLLGTLRSRATETLKEFSAAYGKDEHAAEAPKPAADERGPADGTKRPRPGPGPA